MQERKHHQTGQDNFNPGDLNGHVLCSETKAPPSSSYAAFLHGKLRSECMKDQRLRVNPTDENQNTAAFQNGRRCGQSSMIPLTADPKQQSIPSAPQRLRIRRRSARQETVELLSVLDNLLHQSARHSRKARDEPKICRVAELLVNVVIALNQRCRIICGQEVDENEGAQRNSS